MPHRILLLGAFLYLTTANIVWVLWDTRPAFWDMASHQTAALRVLETFAARGPFGLASLGSATGFYPPLFHSVAAIFYAVLGVSGDAARLANLPATAILMGSTYVVGRRFTNATGGTVAALLVAFYPLSVWLSRESLVDYWLMAMVALAMAVLVSEDGFANRRKAIAFGIVCGLGMLTKWTFVLFLIAPAVWSARRHPARAALAALLAAAVCSVWYVPQLPTLPTLWAINRGGAVAEGDPARFSLEALTFYVRALVSYQIFLPLALLFAGGLAVGLIRRFREWTPLWLWLFGSWLLLLLFENKDPRYSVPLLPAVAVVSGGLFARIGEWGRRAAPRRSASAPARPAVLAVASLILLLIVQHHAISFGNRLLPDAVVIARGGGDALHRDWIAFSQNYLDLWGAPRREDWMIDHVLDQVTRDGPARPDADTIHIGMVPDIPRFDWLAFEYRISVRHDPVTMHRLNALVAEEVRANDYILISEGANGYPGLVPPEADAIGRYVVADPASFSMVESFPIPTGDVIRLYRVESTAGRSR